MPPASSYSTKDFTGFDRYFEVPTDNVTSKYFNNIANKQLQYYLKYNNKKLQLNIPCAIMPHMLGKEMISKYYIVYFHGNAEDLGTSYDFLYDLRQIVKCNIILTEYCGYGLYKQLKPNAKQIEYDAEKIFKYLTTTLEIPRQHIILLGRSMGSGPACLLASKYKTRGLMLISAFTSLKDVAKNMVGFLSKLICDRFKNIEHMESVKCPVLLIHGRKDTLVPYQHSEKLADKLICDVLECYQDGMTHNEYDIDEDIISNVVYFLREKMNIFQKKNDPILSKFENFNQNKFFHIYPEMKPQILFNPPPTQEFINLTQNLNTSKVIIGTLELPLKNIKQSNSQNLYEADQSPNQLNLANLLNQAGEEQDSYILVDNKSNIENDQKDEESSVQLSSGNLEKENFIQVK